MNETHSLWNVCGASEPALDILFLHGLTGSPLDTWSLADSNEYWPKWLCEEFSSVAVHVIGYPASIFKRWAQQEMNLHERASNLLEQLASYGIGQRPVAFVAHSLGGLMVKEMLRTAQESTDSDWNAIVQNTRLVAFIATPHEGSSLASACKFIIPRLSSTHVTYLSNQSGYLSSLNQSYRDLATKNYIKTVAYFEKYKTKDLAIVVSPESADPGVGNSRPVAIDADHISIAKPESRHALIYLSIRRHIGGVLASCSASSKSGDEPSSFSADDYNAASPSDRRDLLQKLIDAGREHEYSMANNWQNKFARKYSKLGLFSSQKERDDEILSRVEQRFLTHVYHDKICKGASNDEISEAVQVHVVDAICNGTDIPRPNPATVLQALYFLTEQCYIQWDPP
ncbi:ABC-three component system protein [Algihabitans albus]|uniref:ABC-three component system protein n=1 Tax=Algihabitans albus TaxID=2164067 RepID=UPI0035D12171